MSVKIFTITHKKFNELGDKMYVPLHVGRALSPDLGYAGDDTGENISAMNCYYSELTGMYWVWKNYKTTDYVGLCHYRRYLINESEKAFTEAEYEEILRQYDLITTKKIKLNFSYFDGYAQNHHIEDLIETGKVISEKYPEYYADYEKIVNSNETYFGNIIVTSKVLFDEYASWLFDIFFEVQKRINVDSYDDYHKRVFGFISEILLLVWVTTRKLSVFECKVGMVGEKVETKEMKLKLAEYFQEKDIQGAKLYFSEFLKKRPDVLMEASDINGELKLAMQVIATSDMEYNTSQKSILDDINDFKELIVHFRMLNNIALRYKEGVELPEDITYLLEHNVSYCALEICVMLLSTETDQSAALLLRLASDMDKSGRYDMEIQLLNRCLEYEQDNEAALKMLDAAAQKQIKLSSD